MNTANTDNTPDGGATDRDPIRRLRSLLLHPRRNFSELGSISLEAITTEIGSSTDAQRSLPRFDEGRTVHERETRHWLTKLPHFELSLATKRIATIDNFRNEGTAYASGYPEIADLYVTQKRSEREESKRLASRFSEMAGARNINVKLSAQLFSRLKADCEGLKAQQMEKDRVKGDIAQTIPLLDIIACEGPADTIEHPFTCPCRMKAFAASSRPWMQHVNYIIKPLNIKSSSIRASGALPHCK